MCGESKGRMGRGHSVYQTNYLRRISYSCRSRTVTYTGVDYSVVQRSVVISEELQTPPRGWQPYCGENVGKTEHSSYLCTSFGVFCGGFLLSPPEKYEQNQTQIEFGEDFLP